jgi:hypothetical protein
MPSRSPRFASTIRKLEDLPSDGGAAVDVLDGANLRIFVRLHELEFALARVTSRRAALERPRRQHACGGSAAVLHRGKVAVMTPLVVGLSGLAATSMSTDPMSSLETHRLLDELFARCWDCHFPKIARSFRNEPAISRPPPHPQGDFPK